MRVSVVSRNTVLAAWTALLNGGSLLVEDGSRPATPETATSTQVLLVTLSFSATAFGTPSGASVAANAIGSGTAAATGTATWARARDSGGTPVADLTVGATGSGADIEFGSVNFQANAQVSISSFTISMPIGT
ncbi:hypothetical protein [Sorangium sp. So ce388]|uniref:hypothetical protein n=1 Tax=Sorangium sp. So ce388 TaxID=3133309 RepID=UPI003F5B751D